MRIDGHREGERLSLTLYKEQQPVGLCRLRTAPGRVELEEFFIDESWRGKGYGSYLPSRPCTPPAAFPPPACTPPRPPRPRPRRPF